MGIWTISATILLCSTIAMGFNCPEDVHTFYHADVDSGCQVYHLCQNSQLRTLSCPLGQAFSHVTSQCEDASTVDCIETIAEHSHHHHDHHNHHHNKRSVDASSDRKTEDTSSNTNTNIFFKINNMLTENCKVTPCTTRSDREDFFDNFVKNFLALYEKINAEENAEVTENFMENEKVRNKREVSKPGIILVDAMMNFTNRYASDTLFGNGTSFLFNLAMPVFYEMMENDQTRLDVLSIFISGKNAFKPVIKEIFNHQNYASIVERVVRIPRRIYENSVNEFLKKNRHVFQKIVERHIKSFAADASHSGPFLGEVIKRFQSGNYPNAEALKKSVLKFYEKHGHMLQTSSGDDIKFYPIKEIIDDAAPIIDIFGKIFMDYFNLNEDSWLYIFGDVPPVKKASPKYAKPLPKLYGKKYL